MPLRNTLHKIAESLHHHDKNQHGHNEPTVAEYKHEEKVYTSAPVDSTFNKPYESYEKTEVTESFATEYGTSAPRSTSVSFATADSGEKVFVDTTLQATQIDSSFETLAPVTDKTVVHETILREKVEEVQPVIHRQIVEPEIHRVIAPVMEHEKKQVFVTEKNLGEIVKETYIEQPTTQVAAQLDAPLDVSTMDIKSSNTVVELAPIIVEHHVRQVIEEIQPVIHRTIQEPELIKERVDIYETIVKAPIVVEEQREAVFVNSSASLGNGTFDNTMFTSQNTAAPVNPFEKKTEEVLWTNQTTVTTQGTVTPKSAF